MIIGGNKINKVTSGKKITSLNGDKYFYKFINLKKNQTLSIPGKSHYCIYNLSKSNYYLEYKNKKKKITDHIILAKNQKIKIISKNKINLLFCGKKIKNSNYSDILLKKKKNIYKVNKPWGYELWINKGSKKFCFKEILIKKGNKTSLQFHKLKTETNFIYSGKCKLYYSITRPKYFKKHHIRSKILSSFHSIFVKSNTIHRIEALTNIKLFEVSTPNLSDVIRLSDDTNRPSGKIVTEHKKN
ncbi:MAG: hypothetical protein CMF54_07235 [Legionellales bacterium]|nr:hypothetical protein [Legionellales bacterium]